ncbi:hypothetical protein AAHH67_17830 [Niallia circulans]
MAGIKKAAIIRIVNKSTHTNSSTKARNIFFFRKIGRRASFTAAIISIAGYLEFEEKI